MKTVFCILLTCFIILSLHAQTNFSEENAKQILKTLSVDIGPRPMGSPSERRAMEFAIETFKKYGCDTAYIMNMDRSSRVNTTSGIAVGIKYGATKRIIVIGGHIDSAGPEIPGADDDGSGSATVIECARVLCSTTPQSTILLGCWGGEEQGLEGSRYFVKHFPDIDSVVLMLQVDMANGLGIIDMDPDTYGKSAPRWLVKAAAEEFRNLGYSNLRYPTHFFSMNYAMPEGSGSDHEAFVAEGIPAIDFSTDVSKPIHTPRDNFENFDTRGLKRSGDLILTLFKRFDGGVPSRTTEQYWLYLVGSTPIFIPYWGIWTFIIISLLLAIIAFIIVRKRREPIDSPDRVQWSGFKMMLYSLVMTICAWFSPDIVGLINGVRHPWLADYNPYYILAGIAFLIGGSIALMMNKKLRLSRCPYVFYKRAIIGLVIFLLVLMLANLKLAVEPAMAIFLVSLAILARHPLIKFTLVLLAPVWMLRLLFSEWDGLIFRTFATALPTSFSGNGFFALIMIGIFSLYILPFLFALAAVLRDNPKLGWPISLMKSRNVFVACILLFSVLAVYLSSQPSFDRWWQREVHIDQTYYMDTHEKEIFVNSPEYFSNLSLHHAQKDTVLDGKSTSTKITPSSSFDTTWLAVERKENHHSSDSVTTFDIELKLASVRRPYMVMVSYTDGKNITRFETPWLFRTVEDAKRITWYSFPDTSITIPVKFQIPSGDSVKEKIEVTYDTLAYPMSLEQELTYFTPRTKYIANHVYGR